MTQYVYAFSEGSKDQKDLLGGKGANLAEMTNLGLPVPPGFTISMARSKPARISTSERQHSSFASVISLTDLPDSAAIRNRSSPWKARLAVLGLTPVLPA